MKRSVLFFVALLCLSLVALEARAVGKERWVSVRTENFTVIGNASEREIREASVRLEQYHSILARLFTGMRSTVQTTVIVFKSDESFKPFRPLYQGKPAPVAGFFQPGRDQNYIAISTERRSDSPYRTVFHELAHLFIDNHLRGLPLCFNEGVAEYYSAFKISDDGRKIAFGQENAQHVRLLDKKELMPLQALLAVDYDSSSYNERGPQAVFYAQSWALVHYLLHRDGQPALEKFTRLTTLLAGGATIEDGLRQAFQADLASIEKGLKSYVRQSPYPAEVKNFDRPLMVNSEARSREMSGAEAQAYLGDLLLHLNRPEEAEGYLRQSLAQNPELVMAQASLGMLRLKQRRATEAVQLLRRAAARDTQNYLTQYYYAYALSREEMGEDGKVSGYGPTAAAAMRAALERARELSPRFIEAYRLQAFLNLALNKQLDEAVALLKRALELAPGRQDIQLVLAQVHVRRLDFTAAREALSPILKRPAELNLREQALGMIEDMKTAEEQAARLNRAEAASEEEAVASASKTESLPAEKAHSSGNQRLAKRFKGERVRGVLKSIKCMETGVALYVETSDRLLRLHGEELKKVFFVAYVVGLERTVNCGVRSPENLVVLTYRPSNNPHAEFDGEAIAIEFVPEDIDIEP